jgi:MoaA/NifB/PqqE/SkfB family radical SAM enzyme
MNTGIGSGIKHLRFIKGNPKVGLRIIKGSILGHLHIDRIRNVQMALTFNCNHKCIMCSSSTFMRKQKELSLDEWKKIVDQLHALGCVHYDLTGGEPTLKGLDFLCVLVRYINRRNDCIVDIATNGTLVDRKWFKRLKKAGLNAVFFDLQSDKANEHNAIANSGDKNFERIMEMIPVAKEEGLNVCINTCLSRDNFPQVKNLLKFCEKNDMLLLINVAAPTGRLGGKDVRLTKFKEDYYRLLNSSAHIRSDTSFNYRGRNMCPGGIEKVYITAYGEVMQCTFCQLSYGSLRDERLRAIYDRMRKNPYVKERSLCKHTFNEKFREEWLNPHMDVKNPPVDVRTVVDKKMK